MNHPEHVQVEPEQMTGVRIKEELFYPSNEDKMLLLLSLMEEEWPEKAIVFANTKHVCEDVHAWLENDGHRVGLLTGDVPQKKRMKIPKSSPRVPWISWSPPTWPPVVCTSPT